MNPAAKTRTSQFSHLEKKTTSIDSFYWKIEYYMETFRSSFERTLTAGDCKQNIPFEVQVPSGTTHFQVHFSYTPQMVDRIRNLLTLTIFDPSGWCGEGHRGGNRQEVMIGEDQATPGYLTGPIRAGKWQVVVNTHMIMPGPELPDAAGDLGNRRACRGIAARLDARSHRLPRAGLVPRGFACSYHSLGCSLGCS